MKSMWGESLPIVEGFSRGELLVAENDDPKVWVELHKSLDTAVQKRSVRHDKKNPSPVMLFQGGFYEAMVGALDRLETENVQGDIAVAEGEEVNLFFHCPKSSFVFQLDELSIEGDTITVKYHYIATGHQAFFSSYFIAPLGTLSPGKYTVEAVPTVSQVTPRRNPADPGAMLSKFIPTPLFSPLEIEILTQQRATDESQSNHAGGADADNEH